MRNLPTNHSSQCYNCCNERISNVMTATIELTLIDLVKIKLFECDIISPCHREEEHSLSP